MSMGENERPCIAGVAGLLENSTTSIQEAVSFLIVSESLAQVAASEHDVMESTRGIDSCCVLCVAWCRYTNIAG